MKKTMKKKLFSMFLALVMIVSVFPVGGFAAEAREEEKPLAMKPPMVDNSSTVKMLSTEIDFAEKDLSPRPKTGAPSEVPDTPYEAYRDPEAILTDDYGYSLADAAFILNGEAEDTRIAYVESEEQLKTAFDSSEVEIVVVTNSFDITSPLNVSRSIAFLAAEPRTIRNQIPFQIIPKADPNDFYAFDYVLSMISAGTGDSPLTTAHRFVFSNIILDCSASVTAFTIHIDTINEQTGAASQALVEGAFTLNGVDLQQYRTITEPIVGYGSIAFVGCLTAGTGCGIFAKDGRNITVEDCNIISSSSATLGVHPGYEGSAQIINSDVSNGDIRVSSISNYSFPRINVEIRDCNVTGGGVGVVGRICRIENVNIDCGSMDTGLGIGNYYSVDIINVSVTDADWGISLRNDVDLVGVINIEDSTIKSSYSTGEGILLYSFLNPGRRDKLTKMTLKNIKECWDYVCADIIDCDIHDNEYGIFGLREVNIFSSKIRNNTKAGIVINNAPISVTDSEITGNGSASSQENGGIVYKAFVREETQVPLVFTNTKFIGNKTGKDGGAIYLPSGYPTATISNCLFEDNMAVRRGGAIFSVDYSSCIFTDNKTEFRRNVASTAYSVPPNITKLYSNIKFASTSVSAHALNNYDVGYWAAYEGATVIPTIASLIPPEKVLVPLGTTAEELQSILESSRPKVKGVLNNGTTVKDITVIWSVAESEYSGESCAAYTIHGKLNLSGIDYANPLSLTADVTVYVGPIIASNVKAAKIEVEYDTTMEEAQAQLEQMRSEVLVSLNVDDGNDNFVPVIWKVSESSYNGNAHGTYTVYGDLNLTGINTFFNPEGYQAEIEVEVKPRKDFVITSVENSGTITVKQYAMLSNEENKTTEFGSPTIFPKLPEKVTVNCEAGSAQLPAKWTVWECDTTKAEEQTIKGYPVCDGTEYWNPQGKYSELIVNVVSCDYMFIDATVPNISLEVLPGTTVEELNALLKEEGSHEFPLYLFDLDSGDQMITFYPLALKEEHCPNYQKDVPGEYEFVIPWPDNIFPPEEGELPELKVTVHVSEPLEIIDVELETISPYQSVPVGHKEFPKIPQQVNVILEGGMKIPVDVIWDWSAYNADLAAEQLIIGELVNLPSKAKQPEGQEFTGKLKAAVKPVAYELTALLSDDPLVADAGLTLSEITQILQPVLTYQIKSVTEGISLTLTRDVAVSLEDEKNPQYDPMDAYEDFVTGTLDLPDNITYNPDSGLDMIPLFTFPVEILKYVPCTVIAREGTDFADIPNKPVSVTAKLSSVGPDGQNKTAVISVNWGTGEGYQPYPADLTDDTCVGVDVEGTLVNKPRYIAATRKKPVLTVSVCREFDIEELSPNRIPGTGELEVPLGASLEDIYGRLEQHTVQLTLKSTNGVLSQQDVSFELCAEQNPDYDPAMEETSSYALVAHLLHDDHIKNPKGLQLEIHIKTMTYDISTAKVTTIKGIAKGTAFEDLPLPEAAGAVRDDGETEFLPTTWDNSKYNSAKLGGQFINGTFNTPLPLHLKNPDNRQPKAYITIVDTEAAVLSMEQVFEKAAGPKRAKAKTEEIPGYVEHKYLLKLQYKDGTIKEEVISLYSEEK